MGNRIILSSQLPKPWSKSIGLNWGHRRAPKKWLGILGGRDSAVDLSSHFFILWAETGHLQVFKRLGLSIRGWHWLLVHESSDAHHSCARLSGKSWEAKYCSGEDRQHRRISAVHLPGRWWPGIAASRWVNMGGWSTVTSLRLKVTAEQQ